METAYATWRKNVKWTKYSNGSQTILSGRFSGRTVTKPEKPRAGVIIIGSSCVSLVVEVEVVDESSFLNLS